MKQLLLLLGLTLSLNLAFGQNATWKLDASHSNVKFAVSHLMVSEMEGNFKKFDGSFESAKPDFTDAKIQFTVDVNSINTDNENRDNHLRSDDFFNAEKFPKMSFTSTSLKKTGANTYVLEGNLTIRDVTKKVAFEVKNGGVTKDPWGNTKTGFKVSGKINRFDYNLKWSKALETGGMVVGDEVGINLLLEFNKA